MSQPNTPSGDRALTLYLAGILVTLAAMIVAFQIAGQSPIVVVVGTDTPAAASASPGSATPPTIASVPPPAPPTVAAKPASIQVIEVAAVPAAEDINHAAWADAPTLEVPLQAQTIARPFLTRATVKQVRIQAMRDARQIAWRIEWDAPAPAWNVDAGRFTDAVALQFPLQPNTPFMMGGPGLPVRILHWKALWQKDIDEGYQQVEDLHPNYYADLYWFATGKFPFPILESLASPEARQFMPALAAGNPMANPERKTPLEEIIAEGFGTATTRDAAPGNAHGTWQDGRWIVTFIRPLDTADPLAAAIQTGHADAIAFAVWDGSNQNVGGRKHWSGWIPMTLVSGSTTP